jgi:hypothetical protein
MYDIEWFGDGDSFLSSMQTPRGTCDSVAQRRSLKCLLGHQRQIRTKRTSIVRINISGEAFTSHPDVWRLIRQKDDCESLHTRGTGPGRGPNLRFEKAWEIMAVRAQMVRLLASLTGLISISQSCRSDFGGAASERSQGDL